MIGKAILKINPNAEVVVLEVMILTLALLNTMEQHQYLKLT